MICATIQRLNRLSRRSKVINTVVIEHVALNELPAAWRAQLFIAPSTRFTVRI